ncbi:MAG: hypothetical protein IT442_05780 [Phycisphaeraceae bacterium]|nr:hypothetical protein [Phycisphaeraceae bacterium]
MRPSKRSFIRAAVLGLVLALLLGMVRRHVDTDRCGKCFSHRVMTQWRWGAGDAWSVALSAVRVTIKPSGALAAFFPASHAHEWVPLPRYCVSGFLCMYETNPGFRTFVDGKLARGEVTAEELAALLPERAGAPLLDPIVMEYFQGRGETPPTVATTAPSP